MFLLPLGLVRRSWPFGQLSGTGAGWFPALHRPCRFAGYNQPFSRRAESQE